MAHSQRVGVADPEPTGPLFSDEICRRIWSEVFPRRAEAMPLDFPARLRLCVDEYRQMIGRPSKAKMNAVTKLLHRQLSKAIALDDPAACADTMEALAPALRLELDRLTPGGIPNSAQLRDPQRGLEAAKELLGCCARGAEIVPGRKRGNGRRSRNRIRLVPRFKRGRGYPRKEAETMLVRALAEYWRSLSDGRFPRSCAHDHQKDQSQFERLVHRVLRRCGEPGPCLVSLVRHVLDDIRDAEAVNQ